MKISDNISFGNYRWLVLDVKDTKALIITECIIDHRSYHNAYEEITWADCALRNYLNNEYYNNFSDVEKDKICTVTNKNLDNQWYGVKGGVDTNDKVFLLSIEELVCKYFGDSSELLYSPRKNKRYWFERKDLNNNKRITTLEDRKSVV